MGSAESEVHSSVHINNDHSEGNNSIHVKTTINGTVVEEYDYTTQDQNFSYESNSVESNSVVNIFQKEITGDLENNKNINETEKTINLSDDNSIRMVVETNSQELNHEMHQKNSIDVDNKRNVEINSSFLDNFFPLSVLINIIDYVAVYFK